jgi:hypothetical protein
MTLRSNRRAIFILVLFLVLASQGRAQDTQPVRIDAGGSCVIDLKQAYDMSGTLSGSLEIDYRILVYGPCEVPPVLGKYDEEWIAHGRFTGAAFGSAASGTLTYTADVAGGHVDGRIVLRGTIDGASLSIRCWPCCRCSTVTLTWWFGRRPPDEDLSRG